jgi:hypothetical protein
MTVMLARLYDDVSWATNTPGGYQPQQGMM